MLPLAADDPAQLFSVLKWLGASTGTTVALACGWMVYTGRLVLKREYDAEAQRLKEMAEDRDEWKDMAMRLLGSGQRALGAAERAASAAEHTVSTALATPPPATTGKP